ncbi:MAG: thioredoxin [Nitrospirae bacterium CG17_big_fil_post_rev_8_21_14_2_50_50_9]|nr:MAG: thioredoxin [Nitrospirae bacterium CG17_big_fil_post_rev_8_21_14_2_50_50_9]PIW84612.1 MAG: thioredoxin [Nitrospirae bacterium CG_4_8_14_3_um_filter_50_41]
MSSLRKKILIPILFLLGLLLIFMLQKHPGSDMVSIEPGKSAPDFMIKDLKGNAVRLSDFRGKLIFLNFWATWCPPCREEMPSIEDLYRSMQGRPFQILAASVDDDPSQVEGFRKFGGYTFPMFTDQRQEAAALYRTTGVPETFLIGPDGTLLYKVIGPRDWTDPQITGVFEQILSKINTNRQP